MSVRFSTLAALALTLSACGGGDAADSEADSSTVTDAIRTPSGSAAAPAADPADPDAGVAASPKEQGAETPGKPDAAPAASSDSGKPSGGTAPGGPGAQRHAGTLAGGDETLESGEFADGYTIEATAGQTITADLASGDFDAYLILRPPSGEQVDNDDADAEGDNGTDARIMHRATESGTYRVVATSYEPGETGAYRLTIRAGGR